MKKRNVAQTQLLIQWQNQTADDATWEDYEVIATRFPNFIHEDMNIFKGEGMRRLESDLGMTVGEGDSIEEEGRMGSRFGQSSTKGGDSAAGPQSLNIRSHTGDYLTGDGTGEGGETKSADKLRVC